MSQGVQKKFSMPVLTPEVLWFLGSPKQDGHLQTPLFGCWLLLLLYVLRDTGKTKKKTKISVTARCKPPDPMLLILYISVTIPVLKTVQQSTPELQSTHTHLSVSQ